ncbi:MAG: hypothetical protein H0X17_13205 [Deltaproteobacteria bacterium]|nr:hypothetical protein [Deltaproteobacteria bacterium]
MTALERDPARRWQSAAAMRDRIRAVIAQPGHAMTDQGVADWMTWVFQQKRGRAPQLTPIMPVPVAVLPAAMVGRGGEVARPSPTGPGQATATAPMRTVVPWTWPNLVWVAGAGALVLLVVASVVWKLFG